MEFEFRKAFSLAFFSQTKAETAIQVRRSGPGDMTSKEDFIAYGDGIEASIAQAVEHLEDAQQHNNRQSKLLFLLSPKYREYHNRKITAINEYTEITKQFLTRKQREHLTTNMLVKVVTAQSGIRNINDQDGYWATIETLPDLMATISTTNQALKDAGYFEDDMYGYFIETLENFEFMYEQSQKVVEAGSWDVFDTEGLKKTTESNFDVNVVFANAQEQWGQATDAYYQKIEENDNKLFETSNYYNENKLAYDPLSKAMSLINSAFPRMKINNDTQPTIIPSEINPDSVSFGTTTGCSISSLL